MTRRPVTRAELEALPAATGLLREIRYADRDDLADLTGDELAAAVRWLRAAAYSCTEGARTLERHLRTLTEQDPQCSTSTPNPPTSTAGEPPSP
mgnify:CR=1 FL=1